MRARSKNQGVKRENSWNPCKKYIKGGRCSWCWQMSHGCQNLQKPTGHNTKVRLAGVIMPLVKAFEPHGPHGPHKSRDAPIPSPRANSSGLIFQKCSEQGSFFKNILAVWSANRALNMVSCTFCQQLSLIEARAPWKQRPYFRDPRSHHTRKNAGFRARECFHPWFHTLPNFPTT